MIEMRDHSPITENGGAKPTPTVAPSDGQEMTENHSGVLRKSKQPAKEGGVMVELDDPVMGTTVFEMKREAFTDFRTIIVS